jgi:hypothetical protein
MHKLEIELDDDAFQRLDQLKRQLRFEGLPTDAAVMAKALLALEWTILLHKKVLGKDIIYLCEVATEQRASTPGKIGSTKKAELLVEPMVVIEDPDLPVGAAPQIVEPAKGQEDLPVGDADAAPPDDLPIGPADSI